MNWNLSSCVPKCFLHLVVPVIFVTTIRKLTEMSMRCRGCLIAGKVHVIHKLLCLNTWSQLLTIDQIILNIWIWNPDINSNKVLILFPGCSQVLIIMTTGKSITKMTFAGYREGNYSGKWKMTFLKQSRRHSNQGSQLLSCLHSRLTLPLLLAVFFHHFQTSCHLSGSQLNRYCCP